MKKISVSIPGGNGRMGKTLLGLIIENEKFNLSSSTCLPNEDEVGIDIGVLVGKAKISKELNTDTSSLFQNSDVLIDFTVPEATMFHARKCYENNLSIVIGTTGLNKLQEEELLNLSKKIPIVYSANFSIGVTLLSSLVSNSTQMLGAEWDIEILEMHHKHKIDAPSGTALLLGKSAAHARDQGGDVVGAHSVIFSSSGERIELVHTAPDRSIFASGALRASHWAATADPGLYSLSDVLINGG